MLHHGRGLDRLRFGADESVHLHDFLAVPAAWKNADLIAKWQRIRELRRVVTGALELARADKTIGASLEAAPVLVVTDPSDKALFKTVDLAEVAITSIGVTVQTSAGLDGLYTLADVKGAARAIHQGSRRQVRPLLAGAGGGARRPPICATAARTRSSA